MTALAGSMGLCAAVLAAAGSVLAATAAARLGSDACLRAARGLLAAVAAALCLTAAAFAAALVASDFRFAAVAGFTERALPASYKLAAFWAGQEGSLLLWALLVSILCSAAALAGLRRLHPREQAGAVAAMAVVCGFFAVLLLFAANPFTLTPGGAPPDGRGLNPQLQDPAMIAHPPLLFMGYSGFAVPFAVMVGVLASGRRDDRWIASIRRWLLFAWMFLGAGILLGAWWAYVELGWGGYWAWDPVENASLLPWLTSTALLHSMMVQQHRGMFRRWSACLIAATFILCILGTYLTRSGVVDSVHTFAGGLLGHFFLGFLVLVTAGSAALIALRWRSLAPERPLEGLLSREGAFLLANVLLVVMAGATLVGTIFPLLSAPFADEPMTVKAAFYNRLVAPAGMVVVALMTLAPILSFGKNAAARIARGLLVPGASALAITGAVAIVSTTSPWALVCVALTALGTVAVIVDLARSVAARRRSTGEGLAGAALRLVDRDHRRYGGQLAHLGIMLVVLGVAGSSLFARERTVTLQAGESAQVESYTVQLVKMEQVRAANYTAVQAAVTLREPGGDASMLQPQRRFYDAWEEPNTEVAIRSGAREDVYITLAGWEPRPEGGPVAAIAVRINPMVSWIWTGGIVLIAGTVLAMVPQLLPAARRAEARQPQEQPVAAGALAPEAAP